VIRMQNVMKDREIKEKISDGYIHARCVIDMVGKPKEFLFDKLKEKVESIKKMEGILLAKYEIGEPEESEKGVFGGFAETEVLFKTRKLMMGFCFEFMPSHFEIFEPDKFVFNSAELGDFLGQILVKLHGWDNLVRTYAQQSKILFKNQSVIVKNMLIVSLRQKPKKLEQLEKEIGLPSKFFWNDVKELMDKGTIVEKDGLLSLKGR
jgi:hypothetical protein